MHRPASTTPSLPPRARSHPPGGQPLQRPRVPVSRAGEAPVETLLTGRAEYRRTQGAYGNIPNSVAVRE